MFPHLSATLSSFSLPAPLWPLVPCPRSSSLYRPDLASRLPQYYNTTPGAGQLNPNGVPYGFHARALAGRTPGFPVLLEGGLSQQRARELVTLLADGNYLDRRQTRDLDAEMLVYNAERRAFAFFSARFAWADSGTISGRLSLVGFPAMDYLQEGQRASDGWVRVKRPMGGWLHGSIEQW